MLFWKHFATYFPRHLLAFGGLVLWIFGFSWLVAKALPDVPAWVILCAVTLVCALLASVGRALLKMIFNI